MKQLVGTRTSVLIRAKYAEDGEVAAAKNYFDRVVHQRAAVPLGTVIARYYALPEYVELENDLRIGADATLLNTYAQHRYVADIRNWYPDFVDVTPRTWCDITDYLCGADPGPVVLKGTTNSRRQQWHTHMYAANKDAARAVWLRLLDDPLVAEQGVVVREFEEFVTYEPAYISCPVTQEYRFFILDGEVLTSGYYWAQAYGPELRLAHPEVDQPPVDWVQQIIAPRLRDRIRFAVADVARHVDGRWRLVELNDGQQAGLSCCSADTLYKELAARLCNNIADGS